MEDKSLDCLLVAYISTSITQLLVYYVGGSGKAKARFE